MLLLLVFNKYIEAQEDRRSQFFNIWFCAFIVKIFKFIIKVRYVSFLQFEINPVLVYNSNFKLEDLYFLLLLFKTHLPTKRV